LLQAAGTVGLAGCGLSPSIEVAYKSLRGQPKTDSGYQVSIAQIRALPYASLGVRLGNGAPGALLLDRYEGDDLVWISGDNIALVTREGRLVKTVGLQRDLRQTQFESPDPLPQIFASGSVDGIAKVERVIDLSSRDSFGVPIESRYEILGPKTIHVIGLTRETIMIREHIVVRMWRWSADNYYWLDQKTGSVQRAIQRYCPEVPEIEYDVLRPAQPAPSTRRS